MGPGNGPRGALRILPRTTRRDRHRRRIGVAMNKVQTGATLADPDDLASTEPLYFRIAQDLLRSIRNGDYPVGSMLPPEVRLCEHYGASRFTVREALRWLTDHNLIDRRRGAGTTVKNSEPSPSFIYRLSSLAEMLKYPEDTYRENLVSTMVQVDPQLADYIGSPIGHEWYLIGGLRRSDRSDLPICWSDIYVLPEFAPLIADETTSNEPVFQRIERERGVVIANAQIRIFASSIEGELARLLRVADGSPALTFVRRYLDETGRNFESTVTIHPEKRFEYALELHRDGAGGLQT